MDYDCIQDKKCCSNGCNKICVSPSLSIGSACKSDSNNQELLPFYLMTKYRRILLISSPKLTSVQSRLYNGLIYGKVGYGISSPPPLPSLSLSLRSVSTSKKVKKTKQLGISHVIPLYPSVMALFIGNT